MLLGNTFSGSSDQEMLFGVAGDTIWHILPVYGNMAREQARLKIESGIKGFNAKLRRGEVHRPVTTIQQGGELRRILERST